MKPKTRVGNKFHWQQDISAREITSFVEQHKLVHLVSTGETQYKIYSGGKNNFHKFYKDNKSNSSC